MRARDRLAKVEQALNRAYPPDACHTCGYPSTRGRGLTVLQHGADHRRCAECQHPIDEEGWSLPRLCADGTAHLKVRIVDEQA